MLNHLVFISFLFLLFLCCCCYTSFHSSSSPSFGPSSISTSCFVIVGNMNRQFVSLLRSEQDTNYPIIGNYTVWEKLLGDDAKLATLHDSFDINRGGVAPSRKFPIKGLLRWMIKYPKVILPGAAVVFETLSSAIQQYPFQDFEKNGK